MSFSYILSSWYWSNIPASLLPAVCFVWTFLLLYSQPWSPVKISCHLGCSFPGSFSSSNLYVFKWHIHPNIKTLASSFEMLGGLWDWVRVLWSPPGGWGADSRSQAVMTSLRVRIQIMFGGQTRARKILLQAASTGSSASDIYSSM